MNKIIEEQKKRIRHLYSFMFRRYRTNTLADGGSIRSESITTDYLKMAQNNRMDKSIRFGWLGEAGSKITSGRVEKMYSFDFNNYQNNATQPTPTSRPYITGNIAPNEKLGLKNPNGGSNFLTHPTISFGANDTWSVTTCLNWNGNNAVATYLLGKQGTDNNTFRLWSGGDQILIRNNNGSDLTGITNKGKGLFGKNSIVTFVAYGNNTVNVYINGLLVGTLSGNTSNVEINSILAFVINDRDFRGSVKSHIIRSQALTQAQVTAEYNYLRSVYPEIESVDIGVETEKIPLASSTFDTDGTSYWQTNELLKSYDSVNKWMNLTSNNSNGRILTTITGSLNKRYRVTFSAKSSNKTNSFIYFQSDCSIQSITNPPLSTSFQTYSFIASRTGNFDYIYLFTGLLSGESVDIDNISIKELPQTWATSNCEMAVTPQGNVIQEMQAAGNVEKITNVADREFSSDTGFWSKTGSTLINGGVATIKSISGEAAGIERAGLLTPNKWVKLSYEIKANRLGELQIFNGTTNLTIDSTVGIKTLFYLVGSSGFFNIARKSTIATDIDIDNISVQEIGWSGSQELYDGIYAQTAGTVEQKTYAAVKAAGFWCHYNNSVDNGAIYGKLYNWFAVKLLQMDIDKYNTDNPTALWGWRVPTQADFQTLSTYLGGDAVSGGKLKLAGTTYWNNPNTGADNSSGFSAIGSGYRSSAEGTFIDILRVHRIKLLNSNLDRFSAYNVSGFLTSNIDDTRVGSSLRLIKTT